MIIVNTPVPAIERRRVSTTLHGDIEEVAVWNLDGLGQSDFVMPDYDTSYIQREGDVNLFSARGVFAQARRHPVATTVVVVGVVAALWMLLRRR